jgi:iron complex outermembrane recepter protein
MGTVRRSRHHAKCAWKARTFAGAAALAGALVATAAAAQGGVIPPRILEPAPAEWPGAPQSRDVEVAVITVVGVDGTVTSAEAETSGPLAGAAVAAARRYRFAPAMRDGAPVASRIRVLVPFRAPPPPPSPRPLTAPAPAPAAPAPAPAAPPVPAAAEADEVSVGGQKRVDTVSAGDMDIKIGQLGDVPRRNAEQLLTLAPGLFLSNPAGEGHASTIFLRGFDAGEGQDIEMRVEGIPINEPSNAHGHGYADTHFVIPELVHRLRVIEGPFDPRQGDFAVAGSIDYGLGLDMRGVMAKAAYGSFGTKRLVALWGPGGASRGTFAGVDVVEGDGFGPNRAHASTRAMAQWETGLGKGYRVSALVTSYAARFDTAGVIRDDDYRNRRLSLCPPDEESQFFCLYDRNQGGAVARHGVSVRVRKDDGQNAFEHQVFATLRPLRIRQNLTGYVTDVTPPPEGQRGDTAEQSYDAVTVGGRGSYNLGWNALGRRQETEIGYYARHDDADSMQRRMRFGFGNNAPYRVDLDNHLRITNVAFYAAAKITPLERLTLRGGLRLDTFAFAVTDRNRPDADRDGARLPSESVDAYGLALQPKISADLEMTRKVHWITSFGVGTRSSDAQALSQGEFAPFARVRALETGVVGNLSGPGWGANARLLGFTTRVERDLVFDEIAARNTFIGASNRFGALSAARFTSAFGLDSQASLTWAEAYVPPGDASELDLAAGRRLPYVPRWVGRIDTSLRRTFRAYGREVGYNLAAGFTYVGPRPLPFEQLGPAFGSFDAAARMRYRMVEVGVEATNLFDRRNKLAVYNYSSNFRARDAFPSRLSQQHFAAGTPRMLMATLTLYFDAPDPVPSGGPNGGS